MAGVRTQVKFHVIQSCCWRLYRVQTSWRLYSVHTKNHFSSFFFFFLCCFISRIKHCMSLYFNSTMPDRMQHATPHSSTPTTMSKILPWPSMSLDLNPNKHTWNELERRVRGRMNAPTKVHESWFRHSSRSGWPSQRKWFTTWPSSCLRDAGQLLIIEEDTPLTDVRVTQSQNTEWLNFFLDEKSFKIVNFDLNQLQNEIWWTWLLVQFSNNDSILKQTQCAFLCLNSIYHWRSTPQFQT